MSAGFLHRLVARAAASPLDGPDGRLPQGAPTSEATAAPDTTPPTAAVATLAWGAGPGVGQDPGGYDTTDAPGTGVGGPGTDGRGAGRGPGSTADASEQAGPTGHPRPSTQPRAATQRAEPVGRRIVGAATSDPRPVRPPKWTETSVGADGDGADPARPDASGAPSPAAATTADLPSAVGGPAAGAANARTSAGTDATDAAAVAGAPATTGVAGAHPGGDAPRDPTSGRATGGDAPAAAGPRGTDVDPHRPARAHAAVQDDAPPPRRRAAGGTEQAADHVTTPAQSTPQQEVVDLHIGTIEIVADAPAVAAPASDPLGRLLAARRHEWSSP